MSTASPAAFSGSIPETYHAALGPLLFEPYARDLAARLTRAGLGPGTRVLELACGTGIVTRRLLEVLPRDGALVATDISEPMLGQAKRNVPADARVTFAQADACVLPFSDAEFDAIVCQYGVMFFPEKEKAMREARRVLRAGGVYLFNVWDSLEHNAMPRIVQRTLDERFGAGAAGFLRKLPHGWSDRAEIERVVRAGGFSSVRVETLAVQTSAPDAATIARGYLLGTPNAGTLAELKADAEAVVAQAGKAIAAELGDRPCRGTVQAVVVEAR
jgi:ubiquinone/menaquinone biosynthesis C-methylase UbiE